MTKEEKFEKLAILDLCTKIEDLYESGEKYGTVKFNDKEWFIEFCLRFRDDENSGN